ncbi:MAG: hypothetical protein PVH61_40115 [Candidatus Aminicenantes bacterium]|jgi:hypothetical protein
MMLYALPGNAEKEEKKRPEEFPKFPLYFNVRKYYTKENDDVNKKVSQPFSFASTIIGLDNPGNPTQCRDFPSALRNKP